MASTREDACGVEPWKALDVEESLGILLSVAPGGFKRGVDCTLAAHNCQEVDACTAFYLADADQLNEEVLLLPEYEMDYCEGNVAKYGATADDGSLHQASYDCTLAGATCIVTEAAGKLHANCQAPPLQCKGPNLSYCDGTRAVVCETTSDGVLSPWVYDCADAFDSHCIDPGSRSIECEGPATGERNCEDGIDGDGDGEVDCDDSNCLHKPPCP